MQSCGHMNIYLGCNEEAHLLNKLYQMMTRLI